MAFNPDPNKQATEILFSCKKKEVQHPVLSFNGSPVSRVSDHKHLGLIFRPSISFISHIIEKIKKSKEKYRNHQTPKQISSILYTESNVQCIS